ncbi:MAG: hypothetical protein ACI9P8_001301 [Bacteroidia bacterium]|jgi:hypothetical protein
MLNLTKYTCFLSILIGLFSCSENRPLEVKNEDQNSTTKLQVLTPAETGITFSNNITEDPSFHYFIYTYAYHGGGVAVGDINGDDLPDIYFTANQLPNKLYLNRGDLKFEDISETAGVSGSSGWTTGVSMADVNADGLLDIYVCMSGMDSIPSTRENLLYINNGDNTFSEEAKEFGLAGAGHTSMAYFADLDHDNDLDMYEVNHRVDWSMNTKVIVDPRFVPGPFETDRLYINNGNGKFEDQTKEAGIENKTWGLSAVIADMNMDGKNDIYVANDFLEPDFLYVNNGDGTYEEKNTDVTNHISFYGMGSDWADFNNDALPDLCVLDMTPADHKRSKQNMASMFPEQFYGMVDLGWHYQYMTNTLQLNNGNGSYSEVAHLAGIDRTDWSWAPLFVDIDNDGWKDLFVTNGIKRDVTNNDFKVKIQEVMKEKGSSLDFESVMNMIPQFVSENQIFRNQGDLTFDQSNGDWSYQQKIISTGAAYADLDADGDMDLITNNLDQSASIIKNTTNDDGQSNFLQFKLTGGIENPFAIGSKVTIETDEGIQYQELFHGRGFQSSVEPIIHFGLGGSRVNSVKIEWYDGTITELIKPKINQRTAINKAGSKVKPERNSVATIFRDVSAKIGLNHHHIENEFDDFKNESLLPHRQSQQGPSLAVGDVNEDGIEDIFVGGSVGQDAVLFIQNESKFERSSSQPWIKYRQSEIIGAHFFDADGDSDLDLYLACGSTEFPVGHPSYRDHLYLNDGSGNFQESENAIPRKAISTKVVRSADIDLDGDLDLFVGGRNVPDAYPTSPESTILINNNGTFENAKSVWTSDLSNIGMVTDAQFADFDNDGKTDLILCGEWMAIQFYRNTGSTFENVTSKFGDPSLKGWWYSLTVDDLDNDGDLDIVAGNLGLNNKFHPSKEKPLEIYMSDFDDNGTNDIVLAKHSQTQCLPVRGRECSSSQMPVLKEKFPTFSLFANADLNSIYGKEKLDNSIHLQATEFRSTILVNDDGKFSFKPLPNSVQIAPINGSVIMDVNDDGHKDMIIAGNMFGAEVETSRYDAGIGSVLLGDGKMNFTPLTVSESGFYTPNNVKALKTIQLQDGKTGIIVGNNDAGIQVFTR